MSIKLTLCWLLAGFTAAVVVQTCSNFWVLSTCAKAYNVYKCEFTVKPIGISGFREAEILDPPLEQSK